jgi:hypothetical protein
MALVAIDPKTGEPIETAKSPSSRRIVVRVLTAATGVLLLLVSIGSMVKPQGFPEMAIGVFAMLASALAIPAIARKASDHFPIVAWSFGPLLGMAALTAFGVVCFIIGVSIEERLDPEASAARQARIETSKQKREADRLAAEQQQKVKDTRTVQQKHAGTEQDINRLWVTVKNALEPCEQAQQSLGQRLRQGAFSAAAYQEAEAGRQVCFASYRKLQSVKLPAYISSESRAATKAGLESCAAAAMARMTFFNVASSIIDGDRRPSQLAAAQSQNDAAQNETLRCVAQIMDGAAKAGVKIAEN